MPESAATPTRRYAAFLSYRHADNREEGRRWAEWLHQALETYEVPRDLAGKPNLRGVPVPGSLYPVFRDEEELPADADLSLNIRRALENSDLLIVLCSPRACQSRFVAEEIRYFKELGKSDRILALMIDGEPNVDDPAKAAQGLAPEMECFPEPLRFGVRTAGGDDPAASRSIDWTQRTEPIAADVRPQNRPGQGYTSAAAYRTALEKAHAHSAPEMRRLEKAFAAQLELARLKLVAGALGVPLGQLRERDAAYRAKKFRRLAAVLGSLALAALLAAGVAVWQRGRAVEAQATAENQRQLAQRNEEDARAAKDRSVVARQAADGLISYMQGDLRTALGAAGRLDLMDNLNARIRRYQEQYPADLSDQKVQAYSQVLRAQQLANEAAALLTHGDVTAALKTYQQGMDIVQELITEHPENLVEYPPMYIRGLASMAQAQEQNDELATARLTAQRGFDFAEKTAAKLPGTTGANEILALSALTLGRIECEQGDYASASEHLRRCLDLKHDQVSREPEDPELQRGLGDAYASLGVVQTKQRDVPGAVQSYQQALVIVQRLAAQDPRNEALQQNLSVCFSNLGQAQKDANNPAAALENYERCLEIARRLAAEDPGNEKWQGDYARAILDLGQMQQERGDPDAALASFQQCREILQKLVARDASNSTWQRNLGGSLLLIGTLQRKKGDSESALTAFSQAHEIITGYVAHDPANKGRQELLASILTELLDAQQSSADRLATSQELLDVRQRLAANEPNNASRQHDVGVAEIKIGSILARDKRTAEARGHYVRCHDIFVALDKAHPGNPSTQEDLAFTLWEIAICTDTTSAEGREESIRCLSEAAAILHQLEKTTALTKLGAGLLGKVESQARRLSIPPTPAGP